MDKVGTRAKYVGRIAIMGVGVLLVAEILLRIINPTPRTQIVRNASMHHTEEGVPVWQDRYTQTRLNEDCPRDSETHDVLVVGSSILFGVELSPGDAFGGQLQKRFDAELGKGRVCVKNYAQPGFIFPNKLAVASREIERMKPSLVIWELTEGDPGSYAMLDGTAYNTTMLRTNAEGLPDLFGLSPGINRFLLKTSRIFEYLTVALAVRDQSPVVALLDFLEHQLPEAIELGRAHGVPILFVIVPPLVDRGEIDVAEARQGYEPNFIRFLRLQPSEIATHVSLAERLRTVSVDTIRIDDIHFNAEGSALAADVVFPMALERL